MEKRQFLLVILLLLCVVLPLSAQWDNPHGQYWVVKNRWNPSLTGETEAITTALVYRYAWTGIKNSPQQTIISVDMPFEFFGRRHGVGIIVNRLSVNERHNSQIAAQYSYKKAIRQGFLNIGVQGGLYKLGYDASTMYINAHSSLTNRGEVIIHPMDKSLIDFNTGVSWTNKNLLFAFSVMHITQPRYYNSTDSIHSSIPRTYNLMFSYNITPFLPLQIKPMIWLQSDGHAQQLQTTLQLEYNRRFSGGVAWRTEDGYLFFASTFIRGAEVGYAYGHHTSGMGANSKGSHELYIRYNFPLNYFKPKRGPQKSIRLL